MGVKSLAQHRAEQAAKEEAQAEYEANKVVWFKIADKQSVFVRPLQELDEGSKNFSAKNGAGVVATEHTKPGKDNFQKKALCTGDEGEPCRGCEMHKFENANNPEYKGAWKQKSRIYVNVLVKGDGDKEPYTAVLSASTNAKSIIGSTLLNYDAENGTITDRWFKISRKGTGPQDTEYSIVAKDPSDDVNVEDYELQDLNRATRAIPYEEQDAFYVLSPVGNPTREESPAPSSDEEPVW